jgi:tol-pal system protein YbgF
MRKLILFALPASLLAVLAGCASTPPEEDPVNIKLNDLDARTARIERVVSNQSLLELAQHVDALQGEVRTLRGRIDELENANQALRKQQRDLYADLERRIGEGGAAGAGAAAGAAAAASAAPEQAAYTQAFDALKAGKYPAAISGFQGFLGSYPKSELADNAQYWLGEAYYASRDFPNAAGAFQAVIEKWPDSRKAPDAWLKLGFAQYEQKHFADARSTLTQVTHKFPDSEVAKRAAERLQYLPAEGSSGSH